MYKIILLFRNLRILYSMFKAMSKKKIPTAIYLIFPRIMSS